MNSKQVKRAVLLMAYGTPETPDQVEAYFTHIRGGRKPSPEAVAALQFKYETIGGQTPLLRITQEVAAKLEAELNRTSGESSEIKVYMGMKHWHPYIADTVVQMAADGVTDVTALVLAPHYSRMSVGSYKTALNEAVAAADADINITYIDRWHHQHEFIQMMAGLVKAGLSEMDSKANDNSAAGAGNGAAGPDAAAAGDIVTVFSAHSLPERIRTWSDPYEEELLASSKTVADAAGLSNWRFAWQSAGETGEPWLGPDILDFLEELSADGVKRVLQVPIGFVCDHLEIMWDIDFEACNRAKELGMQFSRTQLPNASGAFIQTLSSVIKEAQVDPEKYAMHLKAENYG